MCFGIYTCADEVYIYINVFVYAHVYEAMCAARVSSLKLIKLL